MFIFISSSYIYTHTHTHIQAFRDHELPGDITKRIKQQEEKICQQQQELEKLRTETKVAQEEWQKRRASEQEEVFRQQGEELEKLKEKLKEMETKKTEDIGHQPQVRVCVGGLVTCCLCVGGSVTCCLCVGVK